MNVIALALGLIQRHAAVSDMPAILSEGVTERFEVEVAETTEYAKALLERRAGFATALLGKCDPNRLRDPRLRTTAPHERSIALTKRAIDWRDELAKLLPDVMALTMKIEFAEIELIEERRREAEMRDAREARETLGIYVEAIDTIDRLYNDYGVTRRHHATISAEGYRDIAAIILRQPPDTIPVVERNRRRFG